MKRLCFAFIVIALGVGCGKDGKDCPAGFSGEDCNIELTPSRVDLVSLSANVTSTGWDILPSSPPDVFFVVEGSGGAALLTTSVCLDSNTCSWTGTLSFGASETCVIRVFDDDGLGFREQIGSFSLDVYENGGGFPTSLTGTLSGVTVTVGLSYDH
ncbi:MAG: hypothetical protein HUU01_14170 [Saprospiraceae bacterium]|nr:hypothetical protein [Saprospiraceae bacterium]